MFSYYLALYLKITNGLYMTELKTNQVLMDYGNKYFNQRIFASKKIVLYDGLIIKSGNTTFKSKIK